MAAETELTSTQWESICKRIYQGQCVPFLGAAVNVSSEKHRYEGLPLGGEVARQLLNTLTREPANGEVHYLWHDGTQLLDEGPCKEKEAPASARSAAGTGPAGQATHTDEGVPGSPSQQPARDAVLKNMVTVISHDGLCPYKDLIQLRLHDLARVASYLQTETDFSFFEDKLKNLLQPDPGPKPSKVLETLAQLPFKLIITTNYDHLMEQALNESPRNVPFLPVVQPLRGFEEKDVEDWARTLVRWYINQRRTPSEYGPILYKIHGTLGGGEEERALITEEDYIQFLTVIGKEGVGIPGLIKRLIKTSSMLFLGYSLQDWDFRAIYKALIEPLREHRRLRSFAIQEDAPYSRVRFWRDKGVEIYNMDLHDFAQKLSVEYQSYVAGQ
jgi:hypothetical protein